jgi:hypothetical protein
MAQIMLMVQRETSVLRKGVISGPLRNALPKGDLGARYPDVMLHPFHHLFRAQKGACIGTHGRYGALLTPGITSSERGIWRVNQL